jgi:hypothetical protein
MLTILHWDRFLSKSPVTCMPSKHFLVIVLLGISVALDITDNSSFFLGGTGVWSQGFTIQSKTPYLLSHISTVHFAQVILEMGSCELFAWTALMLSFPNYEDYRHEPLEPDDNYLLEMFSWLFFMTLYPSFYFFCPSFPSCLPCSIPSFLLFFSFPFLFFVFWSSYLTMKCWSSLRLCPRLSSLPFKHSKDQPLDYSQLTFALFLGFVLVSKYPYFLLYVFFVLPCIFT